MNTFQRCRYYKLFTNNQNQYQKLTNEKCEPCASLLRNIKKFKNITQVTTTKLTPLENYFLAKL